MCMCTFPRTHQLQADTMLLSMKLKYMKYPPQLANPLLVTYDITNIYHDICMATSSSHFNEKVNHVTLFYDNRNVVSNSFSATPGNLDLFFFSIRTANYLLVNVVFRHSFYSTCWIAYPNQGTCHFAEASIWTMPVTFAKVTLLIHV